MGLVNISSRFWNSGTSFRPATAPLMVSMPNISTAKPSRIMPTSFFLSLLAIMVSPTPMSASTGVKEVGFKSWTKKFPLSSPVRLKIQAVTVVPTLAPHNHVDGLPQGEQAGVHKAHHHHRGGRGALDHRRDPKAREEPQQLLGGQLPQQALQATPRPFFQGSPHQVHPKQEQAQAAN